jgi:hypothetical protein
MKIRGFQRAPSGIGTKGELSQAMQNGFLSVTAIHLLESLMPTEKLQLSIISKRIKLNLESEAGDKHWLQSAYILLPRCQRRNSGEIGSGLRHGFCADWKNDTILQ